MSLGLINPKKRVDNTTTPKIVLYITSEYFSESISFAKIYPRIPLVMPVSCKTAIYFRLRVNFFLPKILLSTIEEKNIEITLPVMRNNITHRIKEMLQSYRK